MSDDPAQPLLEHAVRLWGAEEENSRRLARRVNLNLTIVAAVFGIGLLRFLEFTADPEWFSWVVRGLLILGLVFLSVGGLHLLKFFEFSSDRERAGDEPTIASTKLLLTGDDMEEITDDWRIARFLLFIKTLEAADYLGRRNYDERNRIDEGQQWMLLGFLCILGALVGFLVAPAEQPWVGVAIIGLIFLLALVGYCRAR